MKSKWRRRAGVGLAGMAAVIAMGAAAPAPRPGETYDQRIARRIATIDQKTYEVHRRCYGYQQGIYDLLTRLKPYADEPGAKQLDTLAAFYGPDRGYGLNEKFLSERTLPLDKAAGDQAWGKGVLEWNAQRLLEPERQYKYYIDYGYNQPPPECEAATKKIEAVRILVYQDEFSRELYGKDFIPPYDPR